MSTPCQQAETIGKFKEFMDSTKGLKATMFTLALAVLLQVSTFLFLWGGLTTTVNYHTKSIDTLCAEIKELGVKRHDTSYAKYDPARPQENS